MDKHKIRMADCWLNEKRRKVEGSSALGAIPSRSHSLLRLLWRRPEKKKDAHFYCVVGDGPEEAIIDRRRQRDTGHSLTNS